MKKLKLGIMAHLFKGVRSIYPRGPRHFWFDTHIQGAVEQGMSSMGFGCSQYYLSHGVCRQTEKEEVQYRPYNHKNPAEPPVFTDQS
jgi:hypothetical protein